jgi:arabinan endo-1,5-alpha-L-arabinosidase
VAICAAAAIGLSAVPASSEATGSYDAPDPFILRHAGTYYAFTTGAANLPKCSGGTANMRVPVRSNATYGTWPSTTCFRDAIGDLSPGGPGLFVDNYLDIWAPTVDRNPANGQFVMFFSGRRMLADPGRVCIGRAVSSSVDGPYNASNPNGEICPSGGNWALDPNVWVNPANGRVWLQWREDASASESRLVGQRFSQDGTTPIDTKRVFLSSNNVTWDSFAEGGGTKNIIENPAVFNQSGTWYLAYSGNTYASGNYATGIANCGSTIGTGGTCSRSRHNLSSASQGEAAQLR